MMVSGAAALIVALGEILVQHFKEEAGHNVMIQSDPLRIIEAVITGVSFLGAGTMIRHRSTDQVEGLTTAACIHRLYDDKVISESTKVFAKLGITKKALHSQTIDDRANDITVGPQRPWMEAAGFVQQPMHWCNSFDCMLSGDGADAWRAQLAREAWLV